MRTKDILILSSLLITVMSLAIIKVHADDTNQMINYSNKLLYTNNVYKNNYIKDYKQISNLNSKINDTDEAGYYIDDTGHLTLNTVNNDKPNIGNIQTKVVKNSLSTLNNIKLDIEHILKDTDIKFSLYVDIKNNKVNLTIFNKDSLNNKQTNILTQIQNKYNNDLLIINLTNNTSPSNTAYTIQNGDRIEHTHDSSYLQRDSYSCSASWWVKDKNNFDSIMTAGHCVDKDYLSNGLFDEWYYKGEMLGSITNYEYDENGDWAIIKIDSPLNTHPSTQVPIGGGYWDKISEVGIPIVGERVCKSGATTGVSCGNIDSIDFTVKYKDSIHYNMIKVNLISDYGDSGGSLWKADLNNPTHVLALGIASGSTDGRDSDDETYFTNINTALQESKATFVKSSD